MAGLALTLQQAAWFLPFVLPICLYVAWTDCRGMRIPNHAVLALAAVFLVVGLVAMPLADWAWRLSHLVVVLVAGMVLNAAGAVGAGDAKFAAAAAPFVALGDLLFMMVLLAATILAAFATHRLVKHTALRRLAPDWQSWRSGSDFPMGLALGGTLAIYLALGLIVGTSA
jgi:prepilin peptidase CpaA